MEDPNLSESLSSSNVKLKHKKDETETLIKGVLRVAIETLQALRLSISLSHTHTHSNDCEAFPERMK